MATAARALVTVVGAMVAHPSAGAATATGEGTVTAMAAVTAAAMAMGTGAAGASNALHYGDTIKPARLSVAGFFMRCPFLWKPIPRRGAEPWAADGQGGWGMIAAVLDDSFSGQCNCSAFRTSFSAHGFAMK
jgi:hypothetical protein